MKNVDIEIRKMEVYNEVAKTTGYTGAKMDGDANAYNRIFTTDADREMLERFWVECCNDATTEFKPFLLSVSGQEVGSGVKLYKNYTVKLELSESFDEALVPAMTTALFSYFVNAIASKWYEITNKAESDKYAANALGQMTGVKEKLYYRKKPKRRIPVDNL